VSMLYQGSKSKLSKQILATLQALAPETALIIEPFLGGANMAVRLAAWRPTFAGDACPGLFVSELDAPFNLVAEYRTGCTPAQCTHALDRDFADRLYEVCI
jgi:hypothetical protein